MESFLSKVQAYTSNFTNIFANLLLFFLEENSYSRLPSTLEALLIKLQVDL